MAPELVKMADLARMSGVPAPTIKHYIREGLLPGPTRKTARNMAYYDAALVDRIVAIKRLQREHFLPLNVIRDVLGTDDPVTAAARAIERTIVQAAGARTLTRGELLSAGVAEADLVFLERLGVVAAQGEGAEARFSGDDVELLATLGAARRAGLDATMLPVDILARYVGALRALVRVELEMFRVGVLPRAGDQAEALAEIATTLSERLVVLLRRKLIVPTLAQLEGEDSGRPGVSSKRRRQDA